MSAWARTIERHRRIVLLAYAAVCAAALGASVSRLELDFEVLGMLPHGRPAFDDYKSFVTDFGQLDHLVIVLESSQPRALPAFADALATRLEALDSVRRVRARIDLERIADELFDHHLYAYLDLQDYQEIEGRLAAEAIDERVRGYRAALAMPLDLGAARAIAEDPLQLRPLAAARLGSARERGPGRDGYVWSIDGRALLVTIDPVRSAFDIEFSRSLIDDVRTVIAETRQMAAPERGSARGLHDEYRVLLAGAYVFAVEDAGTLRSDMNRYAILALIGVLLVFAAGYRSLALLPFVALPLIATSLLTFGVSLLLFDQLNAASLSFAAILYGLSIDTAIHFYTRLLQERRRHGPAAAMAATLAGLRRPHVAASLTTTAVFAVIGLSELTAVRQLGLLTAAGMLFNLLEFFTLYPALGFALLERERRKGDGASGRARTLESPFVERIGRAAQSARRPILVAATLAAIGLLPLARGVEIEPSLDRLRPAVSAAFAAQAEVADRFGTDDWTGAVLIRRRDAERALIAAEDVATRLEALLADGTLTEVSGLENLVPSARTQRARLHRFSRLPRTAAAVRLRDSLVARGFAIAPFELFLDDFTADDHQTVTSDSPLLAPLTPLIERHLRRIDDDSVAAVYLRRRDGVSASALAERLDVALAGMPYTFASRPLLEEALGRGLRREAAWFCAAAVIADVIVITATLGSLRAAAAVVVPALLVLEAMLAFMAATGVALGPVNVIAFPLVLGISVDDGLYILEAGRERGDWPAALRHCGRALVVTSLTTIAGFGFLVLSRYPALAGLGMLTCLGLSLCLLSSVMVVPSVMAALTPDPQQDPR